MPSQKFPQKACLGIRGLARLVLLSSAGAGIDATMVDDARRLIVNEVRPENCIVGDKEGLKWKYELVIEKGREMNGISLSTYDFWV